MIPGSACMATEHIYFYCHNLSNNDDNIQESQAIRVSLSAIYKTRQTCDFLSALLFSFHSHDLNIFAAENVALQRICITVNYSYRVFARGNVFLNRCQNQIILADHVNLFKCRPKYFVWSTLITMSATLICRMRQRIICGIRKRFEK